MATNEGEESGAILIAVRQLLEQRTFSVEAAEGIAKLREENAALKTAYQNAERWHGESRAQLSAVKAELETTKSELAALRKREADIIKHERDVAVAQAESKTMLTMAQLIFRNPTIVRTFSGTVPASPSANPNQYVPEKVNVDQTTTETTT